MEQEVKTILERHKNTQSQFEAKEKCKNSTTTIYCSKAWQAGMAVSISSLTDDLASLLTSDSTQENPINN